MNAGEVHVVLGLGFGDEGKGSLVDRLCRGLGSGLADAWPAPDVGERRAAGEVTVVRWNGGPQAAHHVVTRRRTFCFAQLGAGSFVGATTHLWRGMAVDPIALVREAEAFDGGRVLGGVTVDPRCLVVTPWHATLNRMREVARGAARHGSTGRGVAEAKLADEAGLPSVRVGDEGSRARLLRVREWALAEAERVAHGSESLAADLAEPRLLQITHESLELLRMLVNVDERLRPSARVVLEGAQGALLDRDHGEAPWVTPSRVTRVAADEALAELGLAGAPTTAWGVLRAYATRHGAGPFPSEDAGLAAALPEPHNTTGPWQGAMRVGWFDAVLAKRALAFAGPIDRLALTCVDRLVALPELRVRTEAGLVPAPHGEDYLAFLEAGIGRPIDLVSRGPSAGDARLRYRH